MLKPAVRKTPSLEGGRLHTVSRGVGSSSDAPQPRPVLAFSLQTNFYQNAGADREGPIVGQAHCALASLKPVERPCVELLRLLSFRMPKRSTSLRGDAANLYQAPTVRPPCFGARGPEINKARPLAPRSLSRDGSERTHVPCHDTARAALQGKRLARGESRSVSLPERGRGLSVRTSPPICLTHCLASTVASLAGEVEGWGAQGRGRGALLPPWGVETAPKESPVAVSQQRGGDRWFCRESRET